MITTRPTHTTFTGWIFYGLGAAAILLALLVSKGLKLVLCLLIASGRRVQRRAEAKPKEPPASAPIVEYVGRDWSNYEPATTRCLQFPGIGYLNLWAFPSTRVVLRQLTLSDPKLVKAVGARRVPLPKLEWAQGTPLSMIEDDSARLVESWLAKKVQDGAREAPAFDKLASQPVKPKPTLKAAEPNARVASEARQAPYAHGLGRAARPVHEGTLLNLSEMPRLLDGKNVMHLGARLRNKDGAINIIWGNDLHRAADEAGATVGDEVRIEHLGRHPVVLEDGTEAKKSVFSIQVKRKNS